MPMQLRPRAERGWVAETPEEEFVDAVNWFYDFLSDVINDILVRKVDLLKLMVLKFDAVEKINKTYELGQDTRIAELKKDLSAILYRYRQIIDRLYLMAYNYNRLSSRFKPLIMPVDIFIPERDDWVEVSIEDLPSILNRFREKIKELERLLG
jgi:hypothetical protein